FADRYLGPGPALGHSVRFKLFETLPPADRVGDPVFEVVGVVADVRNHGIQERPDPETFIPYTVTSAFSSRGLLVRTSLSPAALQSSLRRELWAVDRGVAMSDVSALGDLLRRFSYAEPRLGVVILGAFAVLGMVLVAIGVYSVIAYTVSRQTHEIGIRMA